MSIDGELNIADLMTMAENEFDLSNEDAVFLYDGKSVTWQPDGRLVNHIAYLTITSTVHSMSRQSAPGVVVSGGSQAQPASSRRSLTLSTTHTTTPTFGK